LDLEHKKSIKRRLRSKSAAIRSILNEWAPIGCSTPEDEYDCLVNAVLVLFQNPCNEQDIENLLVHELTEHFGLEVPSNTSEVAKLLNTVNRDGPAYKSPSDLDGIRFLQVWYEAQCDGNWEHQFGVDIGTLDNPGWRVKISLEDTELEGSSFDRIQVERTETDWYHCWSRTIHSMPPAEQAIWMQC
jgi:hypothetical protein